METRVKLTQREKDTAWRNASLFLDVHLARQAEAEKAGRWQRVELEQRAIDDCRETMREMSSAGDVWLTL